MLFSFYKEIDCIYMTIVIDYIKIRVIDYTKIPVPLFLCVYVLLKHHSICIGHSKDTTVSSQPEVNHAQPNDPPSMPSDQSIHTGEVGNILHLLKLYIIVIYSIRSHVAKLKVKVILKMNLPSLGT